MVKKHFTGCFYKRIYKRIMNYNSQVWFITTTNDISIEYMILYHFIFLGISASPLRKSPVERREEKER